MARQTVETFTDGVLTGTTELSAEASFGGPERIASLEREFTAGELCVIPTYDGVDDVTHPSVVHEPDGWNGYPFWMAFTPYPNDERENPSVVASHDGVNWEVPDGLTNPVVANQFALDEGYEYHSDTEILIVDGTMWMYFRSAHNVAGTEAIYRTTSDDGVTWSTPVEVLSATGAAPSAALLSPSIVQMADGTFAMWTVNDTDLSGGLQRRTSADGTIWSAPTTCTIPEVYETTNPGIWHVTVARVGGTVYALPLTTYGRLLYWKSTDDGVTWTGGASPVMSRSADMEWYRAGWVPRPGTASGPRWDLWVPDRDNTSRRVHYFAGMDLDAADPAVQPPRGIWIPALDFASHTGSPAQTTVASRHRAYGFSGSSLMSVIASRYIPESWDSVRVRLFWTGLTANAGSVRWNVVFGQAAAGASLAPPSYNTGTGGRTASAPAANVLAETQLSHSSRTGWLGGLTSVSVERLATHGEDDYPDSAYLIGVLLEPAA